MFGIAIQGRDMRSALAQIQRADRAGVTTAWGTMHAAGGADLLPLFAAAAAGTSQVGLGTSVVNVWSRHPVTAAHEAWGVAQLAPGRFRLGIGTSGAALVEHRYGLRYARPLARLREYLAAVRELLHTGVIDFQGTLVTARAALPAPCPVPILAGVLQVPAYEAAGELSDGAISWMSPLAYLERHALPALERGAQRAGRSRPPLIAHVPVVVDADRDAARALARSRLARYASAPSYLGMFDTAGHNVRGGYSDDLLDDLLVSGNREQIAAGLRRWCDHGISEVIAQPLHRDDPEAALSEVLAALRMAREG